ncbi:hypothetical protein BDV36DRAFT_284536 [Aspergillus pseudocaelatus]|uniref:Uncharacterized protein n=1 Tax=Aspergillus pseudocaelatus TaxID=1825620 RepID=A0ABQ6WH28_9EURO|nr:hypothetical protein BDV36DRAFT_284536 [Aspergillus pseudocaelatus]
MIGNPMSVIIDTRERSLLESFNKSYHSSYGLVRKPIQGKSVWAFPVIFKTLLEQENQCGSGGGTSSKLDSITSTLAGLLVLQRYTNNVCETSYQYLTSRVLNAKEFLNTALEGLNDLLLNCTLPIKAEGHIFYFDRTYLTKIQSKKLSKINLDTIFSSPESFLLHSLEALVGKIDFRGLACYKVLGSMLASPSVTAVYLIYNPVWDDEVEEYIQCAISNGASHRSGIVAAEYPITVITNLIHYSIEPSSRIKEVGKQMENKIKLHRVVGFVPKAYPDTDNTAKTLVALALQGAHYSPQKLIDRFEQEYYFIIYLYKTHTSRSTNANILAALVLLSNNSRYQPQIEKYIRYLCENISLYYPTILMCEVLMSYIQYWSEGDLPLLIQILCTQNPNGFWGSSDSAEETAYTLLILKSIASFSFTDVVSAEVKNTISKDIDDQLWLDKTLYSIPTTEDTPIDMSTIVIEKMTQYFARLPSQIETLKYRLKTLDIFPTQKTLGEKYIKFGICFWILTNNSCPEYLMSTWIIYSILLTNLSDCTIAVYKDNSLGESSYGKRIWFCFGLNNNLKGNPSSYKRHDLQQELKMPVTISTGQTFCTWLHISAVYDVKSGLVSKSLICEIGYSGDIFPTRQISIEGRLWNDVDSINRDRLLDSDVKAQLIKLAEYEYKCTQAYLDNVAQILENSGRRRISLYL